jgi:serine/threonine-protein kinase
MSQERFIRCKHCGLPHEADRATCPVTGKELRRPRSVEVEVEAEQAPEDESPSVARFYNRLVDSKYRIEELIGRGGMGMVYRAEHTKLGKHVAIKVLTKGHTPGSPSERRFLREARAAGSIGHPNIVEVFDLGNLDDGTPYIVMELLTGETLSERLKVVGALPVPVVVRIAKEIVGALGAAHRKGIIHRDMKPENVFLVRREGAAGETAKILDFGISKTLGSADTMSLTATGAVVGTPYYLSPEQARGARQVDHRVDIWSVGVLMYEAVTGVVPFNADNYNALMIKILHDRPTPPTVFRPLVPAAVEAIILTALAHDPGDRFENADAMLEALRAAEGAARDPYLGQTATELEDMPGGQRAEATVPSLASSAIVEVGDEDPTEVSDSFSHADVKVPKLE